MKLLTTLLLFLSFCVSAQPNPPVKIAKNDTTLRFNKLPMFCERQWVAQYGDGKEYPFGYIYVDGIEGLMFQQVGNFDIDKRGKYVPNKADAKRKFIRRGVTVSHDRHQAHYNIPADVALIPKKHFKELKIKAVPEWVRKYYAYTDTLEHNYRWGAVYNDELCFTYALRFLEKAYAIDPHYIGVDMPLDVHDFFFSQHGIELKLAESYIWAHQEDKAIAVLSAAIQYNPSNLSFYMKLGMIYDRKQEWSAAIETYKQGLALINEDKTYQKSWFAGCISNMYGELKNEPEKKYWRAKCDEYNPTPGVVY